MRERILESGTAAREALAYQSGTGMWYLEHAKAPGDAHDQWVAYGPYSSLDEVSSDVALMAYLAVTYDDSGSREDPDRAPNGEGLLRPATSESRGAPIRFDRYFQGEWRYYSSSGVGMHLIGKPSDPDAFVELLQDESCNPIAARRILDSLLKDGERTTTVMSHLNFNFIGDELAKLGVTLKIVAPRAVNNGITVEMRNNIDHVAFDMLHGDPVVLDRFDAVVKAHIKREHAFISQQMNSATVTTSLGAFSRDREESRAAMANRSRNRNRY